MSLLAYLALICMLVLSPAPAEQNAGIAEIPFTVSDNHVVIDVNINGTGPHTFIFDTGAGGTVIDTDLAGRLGLESVGKVHTMGASGLEEREMLGAATLGIGDVSLDIPGAVSIPLSGLGKGTKGGAKEGVIGYHLLSRYVVTVDYERKVMVLEEPGSFTPPEGGTTVPLQIGMGIPTLETSIVTGDGRELSGTFHVDLGSRFSLTLTKAFTDEHGILNRSKPTLKLFGRGVHGSFENDIGRVRSVRMGELQVLEPVTLFTSATEGALASHGLAGNIGAGILRRFRLTFDYPNSRMILVKNERFSEPDRFDMSGLVFDWQSLSHEGVRLRMVQPGSPAEEAGMQAGDLVLSIEGIPFRDLDRDSVFGLLTKEGATRKIGFRRDGQDPRIVTIILKVLI